jgi:SAM-dependent methyltransferase
MVGFPDHFSALAARYAAYRPHYPPALVTALADRCERHEVAWDIGCGNGQLSVALATRFARVIATEPAQAQLDHAERDPRVEYQRSVAEDSHLPGASVDLAVAAQAAHWFDWPRFVVEAGRVVRPGGLVALVTYRNAELPGDAGRELVGYYSQVEPYWPNGRVHVNNGYRDLVMPWPAVEPPAIDMTARWTRDELVGYITTWSATSRLVAAVGEGPLDDLRRRLAAVWPDGEPREVHWPLTIKLARP